MWESTSSEIKLHEDDFLVLDSRKAQKELVWSNKYGLGETVSDLVNWETRVLSQNNPLEATRESIEKFLSYAEPK